MMVWGQGSVKGGMAWGREGAKRGARETRAVEEVQKSGAYAVCHDVPGRSSDIWKGLQQGAVTYSRVQHQGAVTDSWAHHQGAVTYIRMNPQIAASIDG